MWLVLFFRKSSVSPDNCDTGYYKFLFFHLLCWFVYVRQQLLQVASKFVRNRYVYGKVRGVIVWDNFSNHTTTTSDNETFATKLPRCQTYWTQFNHLSYCYSVQYQKIVLKNYSPEGLRFVDSFISIHHSTDNIYDYHKDLLASSD